MLLNILHVKDSPNSKESSGPHVNSAEVEAPWLRISSASNNGPLINFEKRVY